MKHTRNDLEVMGFYFNEYKKDGKFIIYAKSRTGNLQVTQGCSDKDILEERVIEQLNKLINNTYLALGEAAKNYI